MSEPFTTHSIDLASFIAYAMPDGTHLSTTRDGKGLAFAFASASECQEFADMFFGREPVAIGDVRAFNTAGRTLRTTIKLCERNGRWTKEERL